jgi:hypothetical protein
MGQPDPATDGTRRHEEQMRLWTYHPPDFRLDDPGCAGIDPSRGPYWNDATLPGYKSALTALQALLRIDHSPLWCYTCAGCWSRHLPDPSRVEWLLDVPAVQVLAFVREPLWDAILQGRGGDLRDAVFTAAPERLDANTTALVRFPLLPECRLTRRGPVVPEAWWDELANLRNKPHRLRQRCVDQYLAVAKDERSQPAARELADSRARFLEDGLRMRADAPA